MTRRKGAKVIDPLELAAYNDAEFVALRLSRITARSAPIDTTREEFSQIVEEFQNLHDGDLDALIVSLAYLAGNCLQALSGVSDKGVDELVDELEMAWAEIQVSETANLE